MPSSRNLVALSVGELIGGRLTEADRQVLDRVVRARSGLGASPQPQSASPAGPADRSRWLDFETLPGHAEQRILRSAAAGLGLRDPYFLVHDADAGATTSIDKRPLINFSSYDYLGLNHSPAVRSAAQSETAEPVLVDPRLIQWEPELPAHLPAGPKLSDECESRERKSAEETPSREPMREKLEEVSSSPRGKGRPSKELVHNTQLGYYPVHAPSNRLRFLWLQREAKPPLHLLSVH